MNIIKKTIINLVLLPYIIYDDMKNFFYKIGNK